MTHPKADPIVAFYVGEMKVINKTLSEFGVNAGVNKKTMLGSSFSHIAYYIKRGRGVPKSAVEKVLPELSEAIQDYRRRTPFARQNDPQKFFAVRMATDGLGIEVYPPRKREMPLSMDVLTDVADGHLLAGKSFGRNGEQLELINMAKLPHVLVAGVTGSGKTVMLYNLIASLVHGQSPNDVRIVAIDLKNSDLKPLEGLPHLDSFAGNEEQAFQAIHTVWNELQRRRDDPDYRPNRLVLIVDEAAQLADVTVPGEMFATSDMLSFKKNVDLATIMGKIVAIARTLGINLIVATQHPTEKGGVGSLMAANFPVRLVGSVASKAQAYPATQINMSGAESLPGAGSFLRIENGNAWRVQSFNVADDGLLGLLGVTVDDCRRSVDGTVDDCRFTVDGTVDGRSTSGRNTPMQNSTFPIGKFRALTNAERIAVRDLSTDEQFYYRDELSLRKLSTYVYGSFCTKRNEEIRNALDEQPQIANDHQPTINTIEFPIDGFRPLERIERSEIRLMVANGRFVDDMGVQFRTLTKYVYGKVCPDREDEICRTIGAMQNFDLQRAIDLQRANGNGEVNRCSNE